MKAWPRKGTRMKNQIYPVFLLVLLSIGGVVQADIITVPLAEFVGPVGRYPDVNVIYVDSGVTFSEILSVKIQVSGTITPGLGCGDGVERPVLPYYEVPGTIEMFMDYPEAGSCITNIGPFDGSFSDEQFFECSYDANWDILLDGQEDFIAHITSNLIVLGGIILEYPTAEISEATLIIEGDVVSVCNYLLVGDVNDDCRFDMADFAIMAENWLIDCDLEPLNPACIPK